MSKAKIETLIKDTISQDGLVQTHVKGVQLFRVTEAHRCAPAVYEPSIVAIVSGKKEAILDGQSYVYDSSQYMCCCLSMPVEAGTPQASPESPLLGAYIALDTKLMADIAISIQSTPGHQRTLQKDQLTQGLSLAHWDDNFTDALLRLLELSCHKADSAVLGNGRLKELYYTVLKGEAGLSVLQSFGVGNDIARVIEAFSGRLSDTLTIEEMAAEVGMSRAVFHRKFKQATSMSPIQFIKSMRLNTAAMQIAGGKSVSEAAYEVGYVSPSQFNREFKRLYGQPPRQWSQAKWPTTANLR
ncbi:AraC family transcriptional regulator [Marinomonas epiphytica]